MTRIKDIPNFYDLLHAMEKEVVEADLLNPLQSINRSRATLAGVEEDDPRITELRKLLGVSIEDKPKVDTSKIQNTYDTNLIRLYIEQSGYTYTTISINAGITYATFLKKLNSGKFRYSEIAGVANALGLREEVTESWVLL